MLRKAIFADVDKTLRTPGEPMGEKVKELINKIISNDVLFIYCTGKPCAYMTGAATEWNTKGAWILGSTGSVLYKGTTMPPEGGCEVYPFEQEETMQFQAFITKLRNSLKDCKEVFWQPNGEAASFVETPFWGDDMRVKGKVMTAFYQCWNIMPHDKLKYFDNVEALDIMVASVDKAKGTQWTAKMEGISIENCLTLGDSDNDLPMLLLAKKYGNDYVVGQHKFKDGYEPTHRFDTYEAMLEAVLADIH